MTGRVHLVSRHNRHLYGPEIEQQFRIRRALDGGGRGWTGRLRPEGCDADEFDTQDAVYLLAVERREILGGSRLIPTTGPHVLSEIYSHLAPKGLRRGADIYEWSPVFVAPAYWGAHDSADVRSEILCAVLELCLEEGIGTITGVMDAWLLPRFLDLGWKPEPLGLPVEIDGTPAIAVALTPSRAALETTRRIRGIVDGCLVRRGPRGLLVEPAGRAGSTSSAGADEHRPAE